MNLQMVAVVYKSVFLFCLLNSSIGFGEIISGSDDDNSTVLKKCILEDFSFILLGGFFYVSIWYIVRRARYLVN